MQNNMDSALVKQADTIYPVLSLIKNRWSARSFSDLEISEETLNTILEAASWAPSAMNEQPWRYIVALRGHEDGFTKLLSFLNPANASWAKSAGALIFAFTRINYSATQKENVNAFHDAGLANQNLLLQAHSMGVYSHIMEGFDKIQISKSFGLTEDYKPVCMIALGYLGDADNLAEPFKTRELTPRKRKNNSEYIEYL